jgi:hypothetical protein
MILNDREYIEILAVGLLKYYKTYKHIGDDFNKEQRIIMQLADDIIEELHRLFPYMHDLLLDGITLFEIPYEIHCDRNIDDLNGVDFGYEYIELLVTFISMKRHLPDNYIILSIDVNPLDGLNITHGTILNYFNNIYK